MRLNVLLFLRRCGLFVVVAPTVDTERLHASAQSIDQSLFIQEERLYVAELTHAEWVVEVEVCRNEVDVPGGEVGLEDVHDIQTQLQHVGQRDHHENKTRQYHLPAELEGLLGVDVDYKLLNLIAAPYLLHDEQSRWDQTGNESQHPDLER